MARRLLSTAVPIISRRPTPFTAVTSIHHRTFALNTSGTESASPSKTGQSPAGGANNQAAGSNTGINANKTGQKQTSAHSTQPAGDADVTKRPATSSPTGGAGLGVGEKSMGSGMSGSFNAQADKQGGQIGQGMGDKHSKEVHKDRAGKGTVPSTGNATSGDETLGGTGNAGSQDANNSMDKASRGSKGSMPGSKTPGGARGFATKAAGGASSSTGNTTSVSGIGSAPTSSSANSNTSSGSNSSSTAGKSGSSQSTGTGANSGSSNSTGAKSNLGTASSSGASTTNSTNSAGLGASPPTPNTGSKTPSSSSTTSTTSKSSSTPTSDTTTESTSGQGGAVNSTGSNRAGSSAGGGAARANTGEHSPSGTAGGVGTGGTTTMESVKEKVKDYTGDVSLPSIPAASSYTVIAAVLLGVPLLFVLDPDRNYLKKQYQENQQRLKEEYH